MRRTTSVIAALGAIFIWAGSASANGNGADISGDLLDVNVGSGAQTNANERDNMFDVTAGGNQLTGGGVNSNGGDRTSDDVVLNLGDTPLLANAALDVEVSGNSVAVGGNDSSANSSLSVDGNSGFTNNYGVTAVSLNSGSAASQSVSVNVMSDLSLGGAQ